MFNIGVDNMKTYEEKKTALIDMASLYLDSIKERQTDIDSISFLILKALILPKDDTNLYSQDIEIDEEARSSFVDMEYAKVSALGIQKVENGKIILDDAKAYYNRKFNNISMEELNEIAKKLGEDGFHI